MRRIFSLFPVILLLIISYSLLCFPQEKVKEVNLSLHGGAAFPIGDFGKSVGNDAGFALTGLSMMIDVASHNIGPLLYLNTSASLSFNRMNEDKLLEQLGDADIDLGAGSYTTSWILTGLGINTGSNSLLNVYATVQAGILIWKSPDLIVRIGSRSETIETKADPGFAYSFGAGFIFDRLKFSVKYYGAKPQISQADNKSTIPVNLLQITLGIIIFST